jgi:hypothetical protein
MTGRPLQRDGFIWEVRRTLDESYTCFRGEDQERISIKSVCPYYLSGRQRVPAESLAHFRVAVPPKPIAEAFGCAVKPRFARAGATVRESRTLAALRDTVLPKLISGELRTRTRLGSATTRTQ